MTGEAIGKSIEAFCEQTGHVPADVVNGTEVRDEWVRWLRRAGWLDLEENIEEARKARKALCDGTKDILENSEILKAENIEKLERILPYPGCKFAEVPGQADAIKITLTLPHFAMNDSEVSGPHAVDILRSRLFAVFSDVIGDMEWFGSGYTPEGAVAKDNE